MLKKIVAAIVCLTFSFSNIQYIHAQDFSVNQLPIPGSMVNLSEAFAPLSLKGLVINPQKPLEFQFIVDTGKGPQDSASIKEDANKLVKYFLAGLTIPEGELWVNLSPYEKNRITTPSLGQTTLGRDLLAQDYILKQLTASLIYPEKDLGKEFWSRVYSKAQAQFGTTNIPVNTFNKVWILPDQAQVFQNGPAAYVTKSTLKVMLDEDYTALQKHSKLMSSPNVSVGDLVNTHALGSQVVRQIVIPEITKEVNAGKNFAPLRQIYDAMILAKWYKETFENGILDAVYTNKNKTAGVNLTNPAVKEQIYQRYLQAYKKGVFNYIKEDATPDGKMSPRKYFSGGISKLEPDRVYTDGAMTSVKYFALLALTVSLSVLTPGIIEAQQQRNASSQASFTQSQPAASIGISEDEFQKSLNSLNAYGRDHSKELIFLGNSGDKRAIDPIIKLINDPSSWPYLNIRLAHEALDKLANDSETQFHVGAAVFHYNLGSLEDRSWAYQMLEKSGDKRAIPIVEEGLKYFDDGINVIAQKALDHLANDPDSRYQVGMVGLNYEFGGASTDWAIEMLGKSGDSRAVGPVLESLKDENYFAEAYKAARGLGVDEKIITRIVDAYGWSDSSVARSLDEQLIANGDPLALRIIRSHLGDYGNGEFDLVNGKGLDKQLKEKGAGWWDRQSNGLRFLYIGSLSTFSLIGLLSLWGAWTSGEEERAIKRIKRYELDNNVNSIMKELNNKSTIVRQTARDAIMRIVAGNEKKYQVGLAGMKSPYPDNYTWAMEMLVQSGRDVKGLIEEKLNNVFDYVRLKVRVELDRLLTDPQSQSQTGSLALQGPYADNEVWGIGLLLKSRRDVKNLILDKINTDSQYARSKVRDALDGLLDARGDYEAGLIAFNSQYPDNVLWGINKLLQSGRDVKAVIRGKLNSDHSLIRPAVRNALDLLLTDPQERYGIGLEYIGSIYEDNFTWGIKILTESGDIQAPEDLYGGMKVAERNANYERYNQFSDALHQLGDLRGGQKYLYHEAQGHNESYFNDSYDYGENWVTDKEAYWEKVTRDHAMLGKTPADMAMESKPRKLIFSHDFVYEKVPVLIGSVVFLGVLGAIIAGAMLLNADSPSDSISKSLGWLSSKSYAAYKLAIAHPNSYRISILGIGLGTAFIAWQNYSIRGLSGLLRKGSTDDQEVIRRLKSKGRVAVPALSNLLLEDKAFSGQIISELVEIGDQGAIEPIAKVLSKGMYFEPANQALAKLGAGRETIFQANLKALDKDSKNAIVFLGNWGDRRAVDPIADILSHGKYLEEANQALVNLRADRETIYQANLKALNTGAVSTAIKFLGNFGDIRAIKAIADILVIKNNFYLWETANEALQKLGADHEILLETNLKALEVYPDYHQEKVIQYLGMLRDRRAIFPIIAKLNSDNVSIRKAVINALKNISGEEALKQAANIIGSELFSAEIQGQYERYNEISLRLHELGDARGDFVYIHVFPKWIKTADAVGHDETYEGQYGGTWFVEDVPEQGYHEGVEHWEKAPRPRDAAMLFASDTQKTWHVYNGNFSAIPSDAILDAVGMGEVDVHSIIDPRLRGFMKFLQSRGLNDVVIIGGAVRDAIRGADVHDIDLTVRVNMPKEEIVGVKGVFTQASRSTYEQAETIATRLAQALNVTVDRLRKSDDPVQFRGLNIQYFGPTKIPKPSGDVFIKNIVVDKATGIVDISKTLPEILLVGMSPDGKLVGYKEALMHWLHGYAFLKGDLRDGKNFPELSMLKLMRLRHQFGLAIQESDWELMKRTLAQKRKDTISPPDLVRDEIQKILTVAIDRDLAIEELKDLGFDMTSYAMLSPNYDDYAAKLNALIPLTEEELNKALTGREWKKFHPVTLEALPYEGISVIHNISHEESQRMRLSRMAQELQQKLIDAGLKQMLAFVDLNSFHATTFDLMNEPETRKVFANAQSNPRGLSYNAVRLQVVIKTREFLLKGDGKGYGSPSLNAKVLVTGVGMFAPGVVKLNLQMANESDAESFKVFREKLQAFLLEHVDGYSLVREEVGKLAGHITIGYTMNKPGSKEDVDKFIEILKQINQKFRDGAEYSGIEFDLTQGELTAFSDMSHYTPKRTVFDIDPYVHTPPPDYLSDLQKAEWYIEHIRFAYWVAQNEAVRGLSDLAGKDANVLSRVKELLWDKEWKVHLAAVSILNRWGQNINLDYEAKRTSCLTNWRQEVKASIERKLTVGTELHAELLSYEDVIPVNIYVSNEIVWQIILSQDIYRVSDFTHNWEGHGVRTRYSTNKPELNITVNSVITDHAMLQAGLAEKGGIDLNQIAIKRTGKTIKMQFDPAQLNDLMQGGVEGFAPVIINMTRIASPFQLLGINLAKEPEMPLKV